MKVSVIIPTWNRRYIIEKTIRSVLNQTMQDLEILVCDDGSTDETKEIVRKLNDSRVKWITGRRGGRPAIPRNNGMRQAQGEWLAFLDSDDEWLPEKLEKQLAALEKSGLSAGSTNAQRLIPGEGVVGEYLNIQKEKITFDDLLNVNEIITSSSIIHRSLLEYATGFPEGEEMKAIEDYGFWLRIATKTDFAYLDESLVVYRDDPQNSVRSEDDAKPREQKERVVENFIGWAKNIKEAGRFIEKIKNYKNKTDKGPGVSVRAKEFLVKNFPRLHGIYAKIIKKL